MHYNSGTDKRLGMVKHFHEHGYWINHKDLYGLWGRSTASPSCKHDVTAQRCSWELSRYGGCENQPVWQDMGQNAQVDIEYQQLWKAGEWSLEEEMAKPVRVHL